MFKSKSNQKKTFLAIFALLSLTLAILPFVVTLNEGLAKVLEATFIYRSIEKYIVPYEVKIVASVLSLLGIGSFIQSDGITINGTFLRVTWNCLGWQSLLFLLVSLLVGLGRRYKTLGIIETVSFGISGTFLLNIVRITAISLLGVFYPSVFVVIFHDYLAAILTVLWLIFFWWFSYKFVLEAKTTDR